MLTLKEFELIQSMLHTLKNIKLLDTIEFSITWEKRPVLIINRLGEFEFENPQEVYGCCITFFDEWGYEISRIRYGVGE